VRKKEVSWVREHFGSSAPCKATFFDDRLGVRIRDEVGVDNIMGSSDYPHSDSMWSHSKEQIADHFKDAPEAGKILGGYAARLYQLNPG